MTQEDKSLLLKDLCSRLPYGVKFKADNEECIREIHYIKDENVYIREYQNLPYWIDAIKPYLRPMSSMTEKESYDYYNTFEWEENLNGGHYPNSKTEKTFDWLNANHFDYRGLIPIGLALEAPKDMYNIKEK